MAQGLQPETPDEGWFLRWSVQAVHLIFRDISSLVLVGGLACCLGLFFFSMLEAFGPGSLLFTTFATRAASASLLIVTLAVIMNADGYRGDFSFENIKKIATFCLAAGSLGVVLMMLAVSKAEGSDDGGRTLDMYDLILWKSTMSMSEAILTSFAIFSLWPVILLNFGVTMRTALLQSSMLMMKSPNVWFTISMVTLLTCVVAPKLPSVLGIILCMIWMSWIYVAAREIFGGIRHNSPSPKLSLEGA